MQELLKKKHFVFGNGEYVFVSFDKNDILMNPFENGLLKKGVISISFVSFPYAISVSNFYFSEGDIFLPNLKCSYKDLFSYQTSNFKNPSYYDIIKQIKMNPVAKHNINWEDVDSHLFENILEFENEDYNLDLEVLDKLQITVLDCDEPKLEQDYTLSPKRRIPVVKKSFKNTPDKKIDQSDEDIPIPPTLSGMFDFIKRSPKHFIFNCYMSPETYLSLDLYDRIIINPEMFSNFVLNDSSIDFNYDKKICEGYGIILQCKQRENIFIYNIPDYLSSFEDNIISCITRSLEHKIRINGEKVNIVIVNNCFTKKCKMISFSQILLEHFAIVMYQKDN